MSTALAPVPSVAHRGEMLYVLFQVAGTDFALDASKVLQLETFTGATRVPGTPAFVVGVVQLRGRMIPVVDLRMRFELPAAPITQDSRVIVAEDEGRVVALLADVARDVVRISDAERKPPPALMDRVTTRFVESLAQHKNRTILILNFEKVVGEEQSNVVG